MIDSMFDHYILLWPLENSSPEYTRANTPNNTSDRTFIGVRELTQTVNVLDLNNVNNTQNSSKVSPQQNLPGTGQQSEVSDGESPERHTLYGHSASLANLNEPLPSAKIDQKSLEHLPKHLVLPMW